DPLPHLDEARPGVAEVDPLEADPVAVHRLQPVREAEERRLAGGAGTEHPDDWAPVHLDPDTAAVHHATLAFPNILQGKDVRLVHADAPAVSRRARWPPIWPRRTDRRPPRITSAM